jgi:hypothetical protein
VLARIDDLAAKGKSGQSSKFFKLFNLHDKFQLGMQGGDLVTRLSHPDADFVERRYLQINTSGAGVSFRNPLRAFGFGGYGRSNLTGDKAT